MKNKKTITIIIVIMGLIALISTLSFLAVKFVYGIQEDKRKTNEIITLTEESYKLFKANIDIFNSKREVLHSEIFVDNYYDGMETKTDGWKKLLDEYTVIIKNIDNDSSYLKNNCETVKRLNNNASSKCESFEFAYETVINSYISDITLYNESITGYNDWLNTNNPTSELKPLEMYTNALYTEYIDYNKDGEFFGKD